MQIGCANPGIYGVIAQKDPKLQYARAGIELARRNLDLARRHIQCSAGQHACCKTLYKESYAQLVKHPFAAIPYSL